MTVSHQQFITNAKVQARKLYDAAHALQDMQPQWNANDYGNTLPNGVDANEGATNVLVGAAIFDGANAIVAAIDGGAGANILRIL